MKESDLNSEQSEEEDNIIGNEKINANNLS